MKPRKRYLSTVLSVFAFLVVFAGVSHFFANRSQLRRLERRLDSSLADLVSLRRRLDLISCNSNETSRIFADSSSSFSRVSAPRPVFLGSGRTGPWLYTDVRHADGASRRYYVRADANPEQVKRFVQSLALDARLHAFPVYETDL